MYIQAGQWTLPTQVKSSNTGIAVDLKIPLILDAQQHLMLLTMIDAIETLDPIYLAILCFTVPMLQLKLLAFVTVTCVSLKSGNYKSK